MKEEVRLKTKKKIATETEETLFEREGKTSASPFGSWLKKIMVAPCRIRRPKYNCIFFYVIANDKKKIALKNYD